MQHNNNSNRKTALILEGGAMRGLFSAGVMDVMLEHGIQFDGCAGISAGATFGCNYKSRQIGRVLRYNKQYSKDPRFCSFRSLIKTGDLYGAEFCYYTLPDELDIFDKETFKNNPMKFYVGATDVNTGRITFHLCSDGEHEDVEWMRASASMPLVSRPVAIDGHSYLDGGISDSVPYKFMENRGYNRNVIVLTQPLGYRKKKLRFSKVIKVLMKKYPAVAKAMSRRYIMYNKQMRDIEKREANGTSIVIRPPQPLGIKRTEKDTDELEWVYQLGRAEAKKRIEDIQGFLG